MCIRDSAKTDLLHYANSQLSKALDPNILTIGFARRAATYKRAQLIFRDAQRLIELGAGKIQLIFSKKIRVKYSKLVILPRVHGINNYQKK